MSFNRIKDVFFAFLQMVIFPTFSLMIGLNLVFKGEKGAWLGVSAAALRPWQTLQDQCGVGNSSAVGKLQRSCNLAVIRG
jgi:hypothetical protein